MCVHTIKTRKSLGVVQPERAVTVVREDQGVMETWMLPVMPVCSEELSAPLLSCLRAVKEEDH